MQKLYFFNIGFNFSYRHNLKKRFQNESSTVNVELRIKLKFWESNFYSRCNMRGILNNDHK